MKVTIWLHLDLGASGFPKMVTFSKELEIPNEVVIHRVPLCLSILGRTHRFETTQLTWAQDAGVICEVWWSRLGDEPTVKGLRDSDDWKEMPFRLWQ